MWKKAILRITLAGFIAIGALLVFAASHTARELRKSSCADAGSTVEESKNRGEFIIWETLSRNILSNVKY